VHVPSAGKTNGIHTPEAGPPGGSVPIEVFVKRGGKTMMKKGGIGNLMKQAQKMQSQMAKIQEEMAGRTVEASAGGGMVTAMANGRQELVSLRIEKEVVDPEVVEMLQDLLVAAVNEALKKSQEMVSEEMSKLTGGFQIPGLM